MLSEQADTVVTRAHIHTRVRIMRGGAYGHIRAHIYQICHPSPPHQRCTAAKQKTANFKVASSSRAMQWSALTEEKQKNQLAQTELHFTNTIIIIRGGNYSVFFASTSALHCSKRRQTSRWPLEADKCSGVL